MMDQTADTARAAAVRIIGELRRAGHTALLAGGCVRDALLGVEPKDYDVATDARPEAVRALFKRSRYVGEAFGVVLVSVKGVEVEVATFRSEWGYQDGRRPGEVAFTDAEHDAQRRDFTVNGLFADPLDDKLNPVPVGTTGGDRVIDYVGGLEDLKAKRLRAIGDPDERFREDYLRMLKARGRTAASRSSTASASRSRHRAGCVRGRAHRVTVDPRERCGRGPTDLRYR